MKLILIDTRVGDYQVFVDSRKPDVDYLTFNYAEDTYQTLTIEIAARCLRSGVSYSDIALIQHGVFREHVQILAAESEVILADASPVDAFAPFIGFMKDLKIACGLERFDFLACALYDPTTMKAAFEYIETETGVDLRASTNFTGTAPDGDWIMESDNVDVRETYFTDAVLEWKGRLTLAVPDAPTGVTAVAGAGQATVSFTAPVSDGGATIVSYTVTSSPGGFMATGPASPITVTGLTNGTAYTFTVTATNAAGTGPESDASSPVTPKTVPGAPTGVVATAGNAQASVSFVAPASDGGAAVLSYTVTAFPGGTSVTGPSSPLIVGGLTNGTGYSFVVVATNAVGTGTESASSAVVTPGTVPSAPLAPQATAGYGTVGVSFLPPADTGGRPILSYTAVSVSGDLQQTAAGSPILFSGLNFDTLYAFTVYATNVFGRGPSSAPTAAIAPRQRRIYTVPELIDYSEVIEVGEEFFVRTDRGDFRSQMLEPVGHTATLSAGGAVSQIAITGIPNTAIKLAVGALPSMIDSSVYIFIELFDPDGYPIVEIDPYITVVVDAPALRGPTMRAVNVGSGSSNTATRIGVGQYVFSMGDAEEIQLLDDYVNGGVRDVRIRNVRMDMTVEPLIHGIFT
jgi:hypothetical protein